MRYPTASKQELMAAAGKFRVIGVDLHNGESGNYLLGEFDTLDAAKDCAKLKAGVASPVFIYNDAGELVVRYGSWH
jgi:phosphoribosylpyrophosphate synthetase